MSEEVARAILRRYENLPPRSAAALELVRLTGDPNSSAGDLARVISGDAVFAAKCLRVANSAFYGLSGHVSTLPFSVSVLGFQVIRSLALASLAGLDDPSSAPEGFWQIAAICATAAEQVAPVLGASPGDAFSLGLLHMLGAALLHQHEPVVRLCLPEREDFEEHAAEEREHFGITHHEAAERILLAWHLPVELCEYIGRHHEPLLTQSTPLERTLYTARALADRLLTDQTPHFSEADIVWATDGRIPAMEIAGLTERIAERSEKLLQSIRPQM
jgi:HD-like signal output (HDOD) protein